LEAAVRFIAEENPEAAVLVGNALIDRVAILENFPLLGSPYPKRPGVRKLVSRPYIIFYRFREQENAVDILRYWHGAQREPD
jgi:plasmid stabilization system protein ParE